MRTKIAMVIGGVVTLSLICIAGWSWTPTATKAEFKEHVEDANTKFNTMQERIEDKLDSIENLIKEKHSNE